MSLRNLAEPVTLVRSPTLTNGMSEVSVNGSRPESRISGAISGIARGFRPLTASAMARIWAGVEPQQPPTILTRPSRGEGARSARPSVRGFVIEAEGVGQAGVGIGADQRIGDAGDFLEMLAHGARAERAIEADGERPRMAHRMPERRRRLAGERAPRTVGDGAGDHDRQAPAALGEDLLAGEDRGLGVERVEDGLDEDEIGAAVDQALDLLGIGLAQFVEA